MILDPIARTVMNMMRVRGGTSYLQVKVPPVYDPATSTTTSGIEEYEVRTIVFDYLPKFSGEITTDGTMIKAGDKQVFMNPANIPKPKRGDVVLLSGTKWTVVTVKDHNPSGSNSYLYELFVRT